MSLNTGDERPEILFKERQTFQLGWLRIPLIALSAFLIALSIYIIYQQLFPASPTTDQPLSDFGRIAILILMLAVGIGLPAFIFGAELLVTVDRQFVRITFTPLVRRTIRIESIVYCAPRTIQPIREYVGMGILLSLRGGGLAYAVGGNEGVQIEMDNGSRLFVGSQYPEDLARAVATARTL